jgi:hypothetical protein
MQVQVEVELDRWEERQNVLLGMGEARTDETSVHNAFVEEANNRPTYGRNYTSGRYGLLVRILEHKPGRFLLSASASLYAEKRIKRRRERRERPLRPSYDELGEVRWSLLREGPFADFPWNDEKLEGYIEETLNLLRSPQIPRHYQLHGDYSDEDLA